MVGDVTHHRVRGVALSLEQRRQHLVLGRQPALDRAHVGGVRPLRRIPLATGLCHRNEVSWDNVENPDQGLGSHEG